MLKKCANYLVAKDENGSLYVDKFLLKFQLNFEWIAEIWQKRKIFSFKNRRKKAK